MTDKKISFNEQGTKRIVNVVRKVERTEFHPANRRSFYTDTQYPLHNFIPVKVKSVDDGSSGGVIKHSWVRVELGNDGKWTEKDDWDKGGPDYGTPEKSLLHPDNIAIEPETVVLAHWSIDREYLLAENDHIISYKLEENMAAINTPAKAKAVDGNGDTYGPTFDVVMSPLLFNQFGPALSGWYGFGYFSPKRNYGVEPPSQELNIIYQQRFAMGIEWTVPSGLEDCQELATVTHYWDGEAPTAAFVQLPECFDCGCYKGEQCGTAIYCPDESSDTSQVYHIALIDQSLKVAKLDECATDACIDGSATRNLRIGDGLEYEVISCDDFGCLGKLSNPGICVQGVPCGSSGSSGSCTDVLSIDFLAPIEVEIDSGCPARATVKLADDLITGSGDDCIELTVEQIDCKYKISASFNPDCCSSGSTIVEAGDCVSVDVDEDEETQTTTYTVNNTMTLSGGTCISVDGEGCDKTINNTMTLSGGDCISVSGAGCEKTITNTMTLSGGDCISISGAGCEKTVTNTMSVVGGDGIIVNKSGCTYSVSLAGSQADPTTSFDFLCDVEISLSPLEIVCVESSGEWSFEVSGGELTVTKKYGTLTLPSSLITLDSECGSSGGSDDDPVYSCEDCAECQEGYVPVLRMTDGDCQCIASSNPPIAPPEGYIYCASPQAPIGEGLQFNGVDCNAYPPHVSFTFLGMPEGGTDYSIDVVGDKGSATTIGPTFDHEEIPGQEYWGALNPGFADPQPGECFTFTVTFSGSPFTQTFSGCCS